jgi:ribosome maturation factor RimP
MKINELLEQTIPGLGYELVDVEITPAKTVRIFIDKSGGVTIDDCESVSHHLSKLLLVEEIDYNRLEVSSPGVERPLKKISDYERFVGKQVNIKLHELHDGQKKIQGVILEINDNKIKLNLNGKSEIEIEFDNINKARLVYDFRADLRTKKSIE